jgi:hypothetical protein
MASTVITPVADALATVLNGIAFTPALKVYRWAPRRLDNVPAAVINVPAVRRVALDEGERELGSDDWFLTFTLDLHIDLKVPDRDQQRAVELLEAVIAAVDANPTLGIATIDDTKVVAGEPTYDLSEEARPLLTYDCEVQVWKRVT